MADTRPVPEDFFSDWKSREELAESMIPLIGQLYRRNVVVYCFGRALYNQSVTTIMKALRRVRQVAENELSEKECYPIIQELASLDLGPSHIDVGKLAVDYMENDHDVSLEEFVRNEVKEIVGRHVPPLAKPQDVVLYGFGRIGRLLARLLIEKAGGGQQLVLKAIVLRKGKGDSVAKRASLLRRDSVHGSFQGTIRVLEEEDAFVANGNKIRIIWSNDPATIDYNEYGIDDAIIIDNTGAWRDYDGLSQHKQAKGVKSVILTAPGKSGVKNIVSGINSHILEPDDTVIAAASCTTNAIVPPLKAMNDRFGIIHGHMETVHAYTPDQNLLDSMHKSERRGRSAPLNMVLTSTGASTAVEELLPELKGKLTANSIRVPTPDVSMAILNLTLSRPTTREEVTNYLRSVSLDSSLQRQIDYTTSTEVVSSDFVGSRHACIIDAHAIIVNGRQCVLYVWYDNEFGYSCQVIRVVQKMAGIKYPLVPKGVAETGFDDLSSIAAD